MCGEPAPASVSTADPFEADVVVALNPDAAAFRAVMSVDGDETDR
jgi:hypothetical protein